MLNIRIKDIMFDSKGAKVILTSLVLFMAVVLSIAKELKVILRGKTVERVTRVIGLC